jgi:hypothetical protein
MGANAEIKAASVMGPTASLTGTTYQDGTTQKVISMGALRGVVRVATSLTSVAETLPAVSTPGNASSLSKVNLQGKFLRVKNESLVNSVEFSFGVGAAPTLTYAQVATFAAGSAAAGWRLGPSEWIDVIVPPDATHLAHVLEAGGTVSTIAFYCSEGIVGTK